MWDDCQAYRKQAIEELRRKGFTPNEDFPRNHDWSTDPKVVNLQWEWRKKDCRRDPSEIMLAIIDGLTQEGIPAWPGDATGIIAQIVQVQYDRAEAAEAKLRELQS